MCAKNKEACAENTPIEAMTALTVDVWLEVLSFEDARGHWAGLALAHACRALWRSDLAARAALDTAAGRAALADAFVRFVARDQVRPRPPRWLARAPGAAAALPLRGGTQGALDVFARAAHRGDEELALWAAESARLDECPPARLLAVRCAVQCGAPGLARRLARTEEEHGWIDAEAAAHHLARDAGRATPTQLAAAAVAADAPDVLERAVAAAKGTLPWADLVPYLGPACTRSLVAASPWGLDALRAHDGAGRALPHLRRADALAWLAAAAHYDGRACTEISHGLFLAASRHTDPAVVVAALAFVTGEVGQSLERLCAAHPVDALLALSQAMRAGHLRVADRVARALLAAPLRSDGVKVRVLELYVDQGEAAFAAFAAGPGAAAVASRAMWRRVRAAELAAAHNARALAAALPHLSRRQCLRVAVSWPSARVAPPRELLARAGPAPGTLAVLSSALRAGCAGGVRWLLDARDQRRRGPLPFARAVELLLDAAEGGCVDAARLVLARLVAPHHRDRWSRGEAGVRLAAALARPDASREMQHLLLHEPLPA